MPSMQSEIRETSTTRNVSYGSQRDTFYKLWTTISYYRCGKTYGKKVERLVCMFVYLFIHKFSLVEWRFISLSSPRFGCAWELLLRVVKSKLYAVLPERMLSDEILRA